MEKKTRPIYLSIVAKEDGTDTSFYFGGATVAQLSMLNHELDLMKLEILERLDGAPKDYEMTIDDELDEEVEEC